MVKAHSLLYAVYVCLIVSILSSALLYFSNLYSQLNLYYNLQEALYINNLSVKNFALGHQMVPEEIPQDDESGMSGNYETRSFGLLTVLLCHSYVRNDTVSSAHFVGAYNQNKTAIHLVNFSQPLSYHGTVTIKGDNFLPSKMIETAYISQTHNMLTAVGKITVSDPLLPKINPVFSKIYEPSSSQKVTLSQVEKHKDSIYFNSFFNEPIEITLSNPVLSGLIFKGNFILRAKDSLVIKKDMVLEDVILMAPKITFESGFKGNMQAFANQNIKVGENVVLSYPSVLCIYNKSEKESKITISKNDRISGAVVLFGNPLINIDDNNIEIDSGGLVLGTIYCSGKLFLKSDVYGSVYTNRFFYTTESATYNNRIANVEINPFKLPDYFIAMPLFENKEQTYGILKKIL